MLCGRCAWIQSLSAFIESSGSNHAGSASYSTSISSSACSAIASEVATTQATLSPTYRTLSTASAVSSCPTGRMPYLFGASDPITTVTTPSSASARDASIFLTTACGYGECRILPISIPGRDRSSVYLPWPVVLPAESTSATRLPITENSLINNSVHCGPLFAPMLEKADLLAERFPLRRKLDPRRGALVRNFDAPGLHERAAHRQHDALLRAFRGQLAGIVALDVIRVGVVLPISVVAGNQRAGLQPLRRFHQVLVGGGLLFLIAKGDGITLQLIHGDDERGRDQLAIALQILLGLLEQPQREILYVHVL